MIVVKPFGGLCNRMRALDSALALADKLGDEVTLIWEKNVELNCKFSLLFKPIDKLTVIEKGFWSESHPLRMLSKVKQKLRLTGPFSFGYYDAVLHDSELSKLAKDGIDLAEMLDKKRNPFIISCGRYYGEKPYYTKFQPTEKLIDVINNVTAPFKSYDMVGVHIRRTDNIHAINNSPLSRFIEAMDEELKNNPRTAFFLATDDHATEEELVKRFGSKIITYQKDRSRASEQGIFDAMVDLWALSETRKIIGSYHSSFSHTAAEISNIEEITVKK